MATSTASPKEYRERAAFCEESAAKAASPQTRDVMLYLAKRWRMRKRLATRARCPIR
jgi:hypothetical protein